MTIDELVKISLFAKSGWEGKITPQTTQIERLQMSIDAHRAGIKAVVTALRDEICPLNMRNPADGAVCYVDLQYFFHEILASDGEDAGTACYVLLTKQLEDKR